MSILLCFGQQASVLTAWWIRNLSSRFTPSSSLCLMSTWLHIFMGLYLPPLRIIALLALGVNSLKHVEKHLVWYKHEATNLQEGASYSISLSWVSTAPHIRLTHSCSEFLVAWWLQAEILEVMRDKLMTTVSLYASWGLSHLAVAQSSAPVWWCRAFTIKPRGGWNIISFHLTHPGLFWCDVAKIAPRKIFSLNGSMIYCASFCLCMSFLYSFRWDVVGRKGKRRCDEQCVIW